MTPSSSSESGDARARDWVDSHITTMMGVGAIYRLEGPFSPLAAAAAGPGFTARGGDHSHACIALGMTF